MSLPGACAIKFPVFFNHNNLSFLFHLLHVFLYLVKNTAVVLLGYTHKLEKTREKSKDSPWAIILNVLLLCDTCFANVAAWSINNLPILLNCYVYLEIMWMGRGSP